MSAPTRARAPRWAGIVAGTAVVLAVCLAVAGLGLVALATNGATPDTVGLNVGTVVERVTFVLGTAIGAVIAWRRP